MDKVFKTLGATSHSSRIKCAINGDFNALESSALSYSWFIWKKGYVGETIVRWFN